MVKFKLENGTELELDLKYDEEENRVYLTTPNNVCPDMLDGKWHIITLTADGKMYRNPAMYQSGLTVDENGKIKEE